MKNIFFLLVFIPLFISIKIPYTDIEWEWNWDFDFDYEKFIKNFKSTVPDFILKLKDNLKEFIGYAEEKQKEFLNELKDNVIVLYDKVKEANKMSFDFIEGAIKFGKYLSYKVCNFTDMESYDECRNNKKEVFNKLVDIIHDEFHCSKIIEYLTENVLSDDYEKNLKHILFLINAISSNPDALGKGKAQAVYDAVNCIIDKFEYYWPIIEEKLDENVVKINVQQDITNLLIQTAENLVGVIHFQELDGYIEKANKKYGLIPSKDAKAIHKQIFKMLEKLNNFEDGIYDLSSTLSVSVTLNPKDKEYDINKEFTTEFKDKGIKLTLQSYNLLKNYEASSIQTVVFDSPLVSIRGKNHEEGGTANTFVGITLYNQKGEEIIVEDIDITELRPIIYYRKNLYKAMTTCLFYNEDKDVIENTGVETKTVTLEDGLEYLECIPKHLTSFTIGSYESSSSDKLSGGAIFAIILACLIVVGALGYIIWKKTRKVDNSQLDQAFVNKNGLMSP